MQVVLALPVSFGDTLMVSIPVYFLAGFTYSASAFFTFFLILFVLNLSLDSLYRKDKIVGRRSAHRAQHYGDSGLGRAGNSKSLFPVFCSIHVDECHLNLVLNEASPSGLCLVCRAYGLFFRALPAAVGVGICMLVSARGRPQAFDGHK